jgi:hypothetical protein
LNFTAGTDVEIVLNLIVVTFFVFARFCLTPVTRSISLLLYFVCLLLLHAADKVLNFAFVTFSVIVV